MPTLPAEVVDLLRLLLTAERKDGVSVLLMKATFDADSSPAIMDFIAPLLGIPRPSSEVLQKNLPAYLVASQLTGDAHIRLVVKCALLHPEDVPYDHIIALLQHRRVDSTAAKERYRLMHERQLALSHSRLSPAAPPGAMSIAAAAAAAATAAATKAAAAKPLQQSMGDQTTPDADAEWLLPSDFFLSTLDFSPRATAGLEDQRRESSGSSSSFLSDQTESPSSSADSPGAAGGADGLTLVQQRLQAMMASMTQKDELVASKDELIASKDEMIANLHERIAKLHEMIAKRDECLQEAKSMIEQGRIATAALEERCAELSAELDEANTALEKTRELLQLESAEGPTDQDLIVAEVQRAMSSLAFS